MFWYTLAHVMHAYRGTRTHIHTHKHVQLHMHPCSHVHTIISVLDLITVIDPLNQTVQSAYTLAY